MEAPTNDTNDTKENLLPIRRAPASPFPAEGKTKPIDSVSLAGYHPASFTKRELCSQRCSLPLASDVSF